MLERIELGGQRRARGDDVGQRRAVLALQPLEQREPVLDLLQRRRGRVDAVGVDPQGVRQILELRLDAVPRLEVRDEPRIERRQLADPAPDVAQARQRRLVAVVQRRVASAAQPLQLLGVREHVPRRGQFVVFAGTQRGPFQFAELEANQLEACGLLALVEAQRVQLPAEALQAP